MELTIGEIGLHVSNVERSVRFYRDALGFERCADSAMGESDGSWQKIKSGNVVITLFALKKDEPKFAPAAGPRMTADFMVRDLDEVVARLKAAGAEVLPVQPWPNGRFTLFKDLAGIGWELLEDTTR